MAEKYQLGLREKGVTVPVSIGTALAIEAALGVYPERPVSPAPIHRYKAIWLNIATLFRNLLGSMTAEDQKGVLPGELLAALKEDILGAQFALKAADPELMVVFYLNDYARLAKKYPHASLKKPSTVNQQTYAEVEQATLNLLMKHPPDVMLSRDALQITGHHPPAMIVTHYPFDLLARYRFARLDLLESHSGNIKPPPQWSSKLGIPKEDATHIPFNEFTLQLFGDHSTQFMAQPLALRRAVLHLAKEARWTSVTTMEKIKLSVDRLPDLSIATALAAFL